MENINPEKKEINKNIKKEEVIILGSGLAGLTAAIYTSRANLNPLLITGNEEGGQLTLTTEVENFPGFPEGIMGPELINRMKKQAEKFGTRFINGNATNFEVKGNEFELKINDEIYVCKALIIATGASARWLNIESEKKYKGKGVSTCATCDGFFYKNKNVIVVGGGDSACEEANFLTKFANKVYLVHRRDELRASKIMQDRVFNNPKIEIIWDKEINEILGDENKVTKVKLKDTKNNEISEMEIDGIFLAIGHIPNTNIFKGKIELDEKGYIVTNRRMHTNIKGVFAAGDVQDKIYRQAITAAGSGCQAAIETERYLEELKD